MKILEVLRQNLGKEAVLEGWVHGIRGNNHLKFLQLRVQGHILQIVLEKEKLGEDLFSLWKGLPQETSVRLRGEILPNEKAPFGLEMHFQNGEVLGISKDFPITPKEHGPDFLHNHRHLWLRSKRQLAIMRIRSELSFAIRLFLRELGYVLVDTPILTGSVGESAGTLFETEYFDLGKAYLAQTGQLYLETAIFAHEKVYCFGPTFRAEKSKTKRHLTEFWMLEVETAFFSQEKNQDLQEHMLKRLIQHILEFCYLDLAILDRDIKALEKLVSKEIPRVLYKEALDILQSAGENIHWGEDINAEREDVLTAHFGGAIFLCQFPKEIKAFYMKENPMDSKTVLSADLILPDSGGEVIGGSEREEDLSLLEEKISREGLPKGNYDWYLDLRKYGSVPHSGFGLGLERLVSWISGVGHVRECIPYPRMIYRITP